ncbi:MAG: DUF1957 domain-containing protein [Chloroflexi bacterium]|nr:DUF1957 domain-containing protein [Chloroflexota bacterium]
MKPLERKKKDFWLSPSEEQCLDLLRQCRWKTGVRCPRCRSARVGILHARRLKAHPQARRYLCRACRYQFNDLSGTPFEGSHVPLAKWFLALHWQKNLRGASARQVASMLGVSHKTSLRMLHDLRDSPLATRLAKVIRPHFHQAQLPAGPARVSEGEGKPPRVLEVGKAVFATHGHLSPRASSPSPVAPFQDGLLLEHSLAPETVLKSRPAPALRTKGQGSFVLVLHTHLPYCRLHGRWPHGEEWLHQALAESYIPLLNMLYGLRDRGVPWRLTISLTPVLLEQLGDPLVIEHFETYLKDTIERASRDADRLSRIGDERGEVLARGYLHRYESLFYSFTKRYGRNVVGAFRRLQDEGYLETVSGAATHAYLPLLSQDSSLYGQIKAGLDTHQLHFGKTARGFWLPECAYRPARGNRAGIEDVLGSFGIRYFFAEASSVTGALPQPGAAEQGPAPYDAQSPALAAYPDTVDGRTTYRPYLVGASPVAVLGRNPLTSEQVWSAAHGYPGDHWYREFHKRDDHSGLRYWRVTDRAVDLGHKDIYDPLWAARRVEEHSDHFVGLVERLALEHGETNGNPALIVSAYDTELFGHWWFEGVSWLSRVLEQMAASPIVHMATASEFLDRHPATQAIKLPESSWGLHSDHSTWANGHTAWMWTLLSGAEQRMERLVQRYPSATGPRLLILNQAARELLLLQSSDWLFLTSTGQARDYAVSRFNVHVARFSRLAETAEMGGPKRNEMDFCNQLQYEDNPFPSIDYRDFRRHTVGA